MHRCMCMYVCACVCVFVPVPHIVVCDLAHVNIRRQLATYHNIYMCVWTHTLSYIYTYICLHTYMYIHTHISEAGPLSTQADPAAPQQVTLSKAVDKHFSAG